ncbi:MAG: SGNH/GDSL hydrolase family protein [Leptospira sp.]|nr:SGNH/GDSL hydrolase family protein [Leptospira sp.]
MKFKNILVNVSLVLFSILFTLAISEVIFKIFGFGNATTDNVMNINENGIVLKSDNPKLVYTFKPSFPNETSAQGFRENKIYSKIKSAGTRRIIALGDSVSYGVALNVEKNFLTILENKAPSKGNVKFEIINMSISGYSTSQEVEYLKTYGLEFKPDEVWVFYVLNDASYDGGEFAAIGKEQLLFKKKVEDITLIGQLRKYSNIWKLTETYLFTKKIQDWVETKIEMDKIKYAQKNKIKSYFHAMHMDEYFDETKDSFLELKDLSKKHNFKIKVFIMPFLENRGEYFFQEIHDKVKSTLNEQDIEVFDLLDELKNYELYKFRLSENDTLHLNEDGHKKVSEIMEKHL